jgi:hypothetical protein
MRKTLWLGRLILIFAAITAPNVRADNLFTPTFTCTGSSLGPGPCLFPLPFGSDVIFPGPGAIEELWNTLLFIFPIPTGALPTDTFEWTNSIGAFEDNGQQVIDGVVALEDVTIGPFSTASIEYETGFDQPLTRGGTDMGTITFAPESCGPGLGCIIQGLGSQPTATFTYSPAPEPSSIVLLGTLLLCALGLVARAKRHTAQRPERIQWHTDWNS